MPGLHWIDGLIIVLYLVALTAIGAYFYRRQTSLDDFVKGGRQAGWVVVGLSLMAALNSGVDFVQTPAMVYVVGMVFVASIITWLPLYPWISRVTIPFYRKLEVYSAYEYLELRFGLGVRLIGALIFIFWRVGLMGAALYVPVLAFKGATGIDDPTTITWMIVILGGVVTFYTMLGGMKAVIWTDAMQFFVMFAGLGAMLVIVIGRVPGGVAGVWDAVNGPQADSLRINFTAVIPEMENANGVFSKLFYYFTSEVTAIGIIFAVLVSRLSAFTCDQIAIQRFQTTRDLGEARKAYIINALTDCVWMVLLGAIGLALFAFFQFHPYPSDLKNDQVVPYFMREYFPVGLRGVVLAAIAAASLSSVDAAINSTTSVLVVDFYNRLVRGRVRMGDSEAGDVHQLFVSRTINLLIGILMIATSVFIPTMEKGELYQAVNKILGAFFGPLFGIFFLGMFSRRANSIGVLCGAVAGLLASCFVSFFSEVYWLQRLTQEIFGDETVQFFRDVSWTWSSTVGILVTLIAGYSISIVLQSRSDTDDALTYHRIMKLPSPPREH